jgi:uncharacterized protein
MSAPAVPLPASDEEVPAVWAALGIPGAVDVHVHSMPDRVQRKVWAWFDAKVDADGRPAWPIRYRAPLDERLATLRRLGLRAATALVYAHKPDMADWLTGWALDLADREPLVVPGGTFFPEDGATASTAAALERGARVFKIHVPVGGYDLCDPRMAGAWSLLEETAVPAVVHVGSSPMPHPATGPDGLRRLLQRHPGLRVVVAHMGMAEYGEFLAMAEQHEGVHLDTAVTFTPFCEASDPFPPALLDRLAALGHKVVLGSDFPAIPHDYATQVRSLVALGFGADWLRAVCHDTGARLLGLDPPPGAAG